MSVQKYDLMSCLKKAAHQCAPAGTGLLHGRTHTLGGTAPHRTSWGPPDLPQQAEAHCVQDDSWKVQVSKWQYMEVTYV